MVLVFVLKEIEKITLLLNKQNRTYLNLVSKEFLIYNKIKYSDFCNTQIHFKIYTRYQYTVLSHVLFICFSISVSITIDYQLLLIILYSIKLFLLFYFNLMMNATETSCYI